MCFYSPIPDMAIYVNAGEKEVKRADFGSKLEQWKAMHKSTGASRRPHVVTFQRRDVGSTNEKVIKQQRRDVSTS